MWCLPSQQPGQCPAAGDPFLSSVAVSRSVPLPGVWTRGVLAWTPQGEGLLGPRCAVPSPCGSSPGSGALSPVQLSADPFPSGAPTRRKPPQARGEQLCDRLRGWQGAERLEKCWWYGRGVSVRLLFRGHVVHL